MKGIIFNKFLLNSAVTQINLHARFGRLYMRSAQGKSLGRKDSELQKLLNFYSNFPMGKKWWGIFPMGNFFTFLFPPHSVLEIITRGKKINKCFNYAYNLHHPQFVATARYMENMVFFFVISPWGKFPHQFPHGELFHFSQPHFMSFEVNHMRIGK